MLRSLKYGTVLFVCLVTVSCGSPREKPDLASNGSPREKSDLASKVALIELRLSGIESRLETLTNAEGILDPTEKGFSICKTNNGHLLVAVEDVVPYGDGQKIILRIGNPYNMTFNGLKIKVRYGKRPPDMTSLSDGESAADWLSAYASWKKSLRIKELSLTDDLQPGRWNRVAVILAPANADEVSYIGIKIDTDRVSLFGR